MRTPPHHIHHITELPFLYPTHTPTCIPAAPRPPPPPATTTPTRPTTAAHHVHSWFQFIVVLHVIFVLVLGRAATAERRRAARAAATPSPASAERGASPPSVARPDPSVLAAMPVGLSWPEPMCHPLGCEKWLLVEATSLPGLRGGGVPEQGSRTEFQGARAPPASSKPTHWVHVRVRTTAPQGGSRWSFFNCSLSISPYSYSTTAFIADSPFAHGMRGEAVARGESSDADGLVFRFFREQAEHEADGENEPTPARPRMRRTATV